MRHLLGIEDLTTREIADILDRADFYAKTLRKGKSSAARLKGKIVLTLFFEPSTRTLVSFEIAARRLGASVIDWRPERSSLTKGESFTDTIDTLNALRPDAIIIRHSEYGAPGFVAGRVDCPVINAGDSWREHPTQALLDALTLRQHFGTIEGLTVAIVGDIAHSRVAASNMILLRKMGANVRIIAPPMLMPEKLPAQGIEKFSSLESGLPGADAIITLRLQKERMDTALIKSDAAYFNEFGITAQILDALAPKAVVMDPGPLVRGVQIADDVADDPRRSLILKQVANGVPTRMSVLDVVMNS